MINQSPNLSLNSFLYFSMPAFIVYHVYPYIHVFSYPLFFFFFFFFFYLISHFSPLFLPLFLFFFFSTHRDLNLPPLNEIHALHLRPYARPLLRTQPQPLSLSLSLFPSLFHVLSSACA